MLFDNFNQLEYEGSFLHFVEYNIHEMLHMGIIWVCFK